ncbi:MAG: aminotransferase class V-fold PLP-dependent enzyme [Ignavibacteriae bacterium]|nr:aminotransferase class V-fold PLP-dependent enzyme [Ignavibacteriota bacterium]
MTQHRNAPIDISPEEFRSAGHQLVDRIAEHLSEIRGLPVTRSESPSQIRKALGTGSVPAKGSPTNELLQDTASLLFDHSLLNGHPGFWGYINASGAPMGALADLLAASVNANVGAYALSPLATEMEKQSVQWIAELIGYPSDSGGILVSGGNMANLVCFLAGRKAKTPWEIRTKGIGGDGKTLRVYCSSETHTWVQKAADMFGLGTDSIVWIPVDNTLRMDIAALRREIESDKKQGNIPLMVIGAAGTVGTGAVDPLREIAAVCREHNIWFHVDGAYGAAAAVMPDASEDLKALSLTDSVAVDPHKWFYVPFEAGCALVRNKQALLDAFSYHPVYYKFHDGEEPPTNFYEYGPQNSRGFRALKVWLLLRQIGREGYIQMIGDDIRLSKEMYRALQQHPEIQTFTQGLSITTFRYVPQDVQRGEKTSEEYLNKLNTELLTRLQASGKVYPSNSVINGAFVIRACIVNFRTTLEDVLALPELVVKLGKLVDGDLREKELKV